VLIVLVTERVAVERVAEPVVYFEQAVIELVVGLNFDLFGFLAFLFYSRK
jgi:hypothetical protein